jgi:hypothetical protein
MAEYVNRSFEKQSTRQLQGSVWRCRLQMRRRPQRRPNEDVTEQALGKLDELAIDAAHTNPPAAASRFCSRSWVGSWPRTLFVTLRAGTLPSLQHLALSSRLPPRQHAHVSLHRLRLRFAVASRCARPICRPSRGDHLRRNLHWQQLRLCLRVLWNTICQASVSPFLRSSAS